jgi:protocatechuate 3,4-dioxygenase beta subunit
MKSIIFVVTFLIVSATSCKSQNHNSKSQPQVGGPCEGCEAIFEYGDKKLSPTDTLPGFSENESKLKITGTLFKIDGKTPAADVILYIYHTNRDGIYPVRGDESGWARRHGYIRGWIKTGSDGKYTFYTFRPASYPDRSEPQHIHVTVKEPGKNEYYLDSYFFDDDPLLTDNHRKTANRGGSGIVQIESGDEISYIHRDIILGLNIPDYK